MTQSGNELAAFRLVAQYRVPPILHVSKKLINYYKNKKFHADSVLIIFERFRKRNSVLSSTYL
jgi:hypothetical protein